MLMTKGILQRARKANADTKNIKRASKDIVVKSKSPS